jgi:hypothetical protein
VIQKVIYIYCTGSDESMLNVQMKKYILLSFVLLGCEPEKEVVDVDPNIFDTEEEGLEIAGDWTMVSLDDIAYPDLTSERYEEEGLTFKVYDGFGYGLGILVDGSTELTSAESHTLFVDDVLDENESYLYIETEATGAVVEGEEFYEMELLYNDGVTLNFTCTLPAATQLSCTFIENEETKIAVFERGDVEKAVSDIPIEETEPE